jgi:hypothetical protein
MYLKDTFLSVEPKIKPEILTLFLVAMFSIVFYAIQILFAAD